MKLLRCTHGSIIDYVVDLRKNSPTYLRWLSIELSEQNRKQIYIPHGFGHAFRTLTDNCEIIYKVDCWYDPSSDRSIAWNDSQINIDWEVTDVIMSDKDKNAPWLKDSDINF